jgi:AraC-like DNA-binding protein
MRQELDPSTIVRTSDFTGFERLRVVIRELPKSGSFGTGEKGVPFFGLAYRPGGERGRLVCRFREAPDLEIRPTRIQFLGPPGRPFEASYSDANGKVVTFEIQPEFIAETIERAGIVPIKIDQVPPARIFINRRVDYLCSLLMYETQHEERVASLYFESIATALVVAIASQIDSRLPDAGNIYVQNQHVQKGLTYIATNFRSKLSLPEIAAASHLSPFHFSRLFSRLVGLSPSEYVLQYRLRVAERLLCFPGADCSIAEIASESGFADQAHFARSFRRAFGKTPQQFRRDREQTETTTRLSELHRRSQPRLQCRQGAVCSHSK